VQNAVAQALGLGAGGEQQALGPREEVVCDPHELEPDTVVLEIAEWQVAQAGVLVVANVVLGSCATAVIALNVGDIAGLVCEDRLEAPPVVVGEGESGAVVRRGWRDQAVRPGRANGFKKGQARRRGEPYHVSPMPDDQRQQQPPPPPDESLRQLEEARSGLIVSPAISVEPAGPNEPLGGMPAPEPVSLNPQTPAAPPPPPPDE
jgi:hypothetical protein